MTFEDIVIARSYVDAYMIYWGTYKGVVIDMAEQIVTIHQGRDRYSNRAERREGKDYNWNKLVMKKRFGTLANARFMLSEKDGKLQIERKSFIRYAKRKGKSLVCVNHFFANGAHHLFFVHCRAFSIASFQSRIDQYEKNAKSIIHFLQLRLFGEFPPTL